MQTSRRDADREVGGKAMQGAIADKEYDFSHPG
jgi:hypothetical protein